MAPLPPLVIAGATAVGKTVLQGTVLAGSTVAAVTGINALSEKGDHGSQNVTGALLAHLKQKEQHQNAFFLFDFEGGVGYFAVAAMIILILVTYCGVAHCCGITPMAKQNMAKHHAMIAMLTAQRPGRRTSVISVRNNVQAASPGGINGLITPREPVPSTNPGRVGEGAGPKRRESSVIPLDDDTTEV